MIMMIEMITIMTIETITIMMIEMYNNNDDDDDNNVNNEYNNNDNLIIINPTYLDIQAHILIFEVYGQIYPNHQLHQ